MKSVQPTDPSKKEHWHNFTKVEVQNSEELSGALQHPRYPRNKKIGQILLDLGVLKREQLSHVLDIQSASDDKLGHIIQHLGILTADQIGQALSERLGFPFVKLRDFDIDPKVIALIPEEIARKNLVMPLYIDPDRSSLVIAMDDPTDNTAIELLNFVTGKVLDIAITTREDIEHTIAKYYGPFDDQAMLADIMTSVSTDKELSAEEYFKLGQQKPTVRLVQNIINDAINSHASDIHIRPRENNVDLYFRIDGTLIKIRTFNREMLGPVTSRIKIIGSLNIAEHRLPQDGQARVINHNDPVDLRISIIPTIHGESTVIRILDTRDSLRRISDIGFSAHDSEVFSNLVSKSHGLLLVTGPTGSGKSTTLYASLNELKPKNLNIITVEDPVEYTIDGTDQIQVQRQSGYTFARALKHILRHDPDVIMVGEIRDQETAKMAIESSLTGHLVLSTLHTNSAATSITRLLEIGIEPYLVNSSLIGILAQRLVRKNCTHCIDEEEVSDEIKKDLGADLTEKFYKGRGCDSCHQTGYSGRIAVYELMVVDAGLRKLITESVESETLEKYAIEHGMLPLTKQALEIARSRKTSLAEAFRVRLT